MRSSKTSSWHIGYAEADITPGPGTSYMSGYGRERYVKGVHSRLRAQALALGDGTAGALILAADVLGHSRFFVDAVRAKLEAQYGIPPEAVTMPASHTHWGPAVNYQLNLAVGPPNPWYMAFLEDTLIEIAGRALEDAAPASLRFGRFDAQIGMNRRPDAGRAMGPNPEGVYDRDTPVLRVDRRRSPKEILLVSHACHPTASGTMDRWSADWPGTLRSHIERRRKDAKVVFALGCAADAKLTYTDGRTGEVQFAASPSRSRQGGVKLAHRVLTHLERGEWRRLAPRVRTARAVGSLSLKKPAPKREIEREARLGDPRSHLTWWARQSLAFPDARRAVDYEVQAWRLGELGTFFLEGEVCADLGMAARALAGDDPAVSIGYANACLGYISSARIIREGGYEGDTSHKAYFLPAPFAEKSESEFKDLCTKALEKAS